MVLSVSLCALLGYLIGSLSFAVWIAKSRGVDILKEGSGNPGATNVKRVLGKKAGNTVFFLDFLKGCVAVGLGLWIVGDPGGIAGAVGAVLGHSASIFIRFRGGKGVAVTMGALLVLMPITLLTGLVIWVITFKVSRYVSLASILFAISLPVTALILNQIWGLVSQPLVIFAALIAVLIVVRHRSNLVRLINGQEHKFTGKSSQ
ncbi:glycerol-3-phosphate 1-O-acyltransferase PlsY [Puniceicoccus vermicola]|uniref:Glycerol-3-phosphate acyltransferase n=1 Tax=Puniceicoccus vermicola TaxID=388746 RepID=A0A7X1E664_9BACT|nr:glycerol-3-phosphate 1-O-acyltransferase PlsY [Puniceicoccus vermicola]MBC2604355.1 glycerol-3-phosphate 1-O-acyltransferase PlsY [Puniceicoccus vermicola]